MKIYKTLSLLALSVFIFAACEKIMAPENDNHSTLDRVYDEPGFAEGLLLRAFTYIPTNDYRWDEVATDDAVSNDKLNSFSRIARGEWSALYDPQSVWDNSNRAIIYIDKFLEVVDDIPWKLTNMEQNGLFIKRLKGESYALRGMFKYYLLRNHGGFSADGQMLGTPLFNNFPESETEFSTPRSSFNECVASANADFDEALKYHPRISAISLLFHRFRPSSLKLPT